MEKQHLWQGQWIDDAEFEKRLERLSEWRPAVLGLEMDLTALLLASHKYSEQLKAKKGNYKELLACLTDDGRMPESDVAAMLAELATLLTRDELDKKLRCELGSLKPFVPARKTFSDDIFESWAPLGILAHIAPSNSAGVAPLSVLEGMLAGNVNLLKSSSSDTIFPSLFWEGLFACDATCTLKHFVVSARFSSSREVWMDRLLSIADGTVVWGGEDAVNAVRKRAPAASRVIEWGHKISFIYFSKEMAGDPKLLERAALECCLFEQQACSSPQCIYIDTDDWDFVKSFGKKFSEVLDRVSDKHPVIAPAPEESAEITLVTELTREESYMDLTRVIAAPGKNWRILMDRRPALTPSPLFRTIWIKPLPRKNAAATLSGMSTYLQTVGLACSVSELPELSSIMIKSGAIRIRRIGEMPGSYSGEPHDGVYALQRYCRRISVQGHGCEGISSFDDLKAGSPPPWTKKPPIMTKAEFQKAEIDPAFAKMFFKSGGSSGEPKLSIFTYEDYDEQMAIGADGLYAAGLDPRVDRSINLFFSGGLYGGFISIFSVLERLRAVQFPMAANTDFKMVTDTIVKNKINVVMAMPSYVIELFENAADTLKKYGGVKKIFYGGEHFSDAQRKHLTNKFGVESIKSLAYGSVDAGPLGYQCVHCEPGVHHLHQSLQYLEIVKLDADEPVTSPFEVGRFLFSSLVRKGQKIERYEIGDVGYWVEGPCPCHRKSPRFKLMGRTGDVFRIGTEFFNYQRFVQILSEKKNYSGPVQVILGQDGIKEKLTVKITNEGVGNEDECRKVLLENYDDLHEAVVKDKVLVLEVMFAPMNAFEKIKGSGKLTRILDLRER